MTSTTAGPQAEVLKEIQALFDWNPPRLIPPDLPSRKKPSTASTSPRQPAFYDKHFSSDLVLERIERLPSLVQDLARNVDTSLRAALKTLPPLDGFTTAQNRTIYMRTLETIVADQKGVASFYDITTAKFCSPLASTLALHPTASDSQWHTLLAWTQSVYPSGYAIMDGVLRFSIKGVDEETRAARRAIVDGMESETRRIFEKIRKSLWPVATWEMKSISAGPREVMTTVPTLGDFSWTIYDIPDCMKNPKCDKEREKVAEAAVGPDARAPPWRFPDHLETSHDPENSDEAIDILPPLIESLPTTPQRPATRPVTRSAAASGSSMLTPPPPSVSNASEHVSPTKGKRKRDDASEHVSPTMDKGKKRKLNDDDKAYQDQQDLTAQSIVQQAWAHAVRVDGTVIIIHSGNYELVCIRHRTSQTLYVSDLIQPPTCANPGYGKLQVGIFVAAIQDVMDRHKQLATMSQPNSPGGSDSISGDIDRDNHNPGSGSGREDGGDRGGRREGGDGAGKSGRFQGSAGRNDPNPDELVAIENTIHMASSRDMALLYLRYGVYDSPVPASFLRSAPSILAHTRCLTPPFSPRAIHTHRLEDCLTIVLASEIGWGATGVVHRGTLKPELSDGTVLLDVVVKLAFDDEQRDALRDEYKVYRRLRSKGVLRGITTVLGFFDDSKGSACALVMLYAGVPLVAEPQDILSVSDRKSALSTLESIHRAGILHGDIRRENILMGDLGVTIIDFGYSKQCDDQEAKDKELARLRYLLGLACSSH